MNVYLSPQSSCNAEYKADISHLLAVDDGIIMEDFNAHHQLWHSSGTHNTRGEEIADQIDNANYGVINENTHTRVAANVNSPQDITMVHHTLITSADWKADLALSSDHLPITISMDIEIDIIESEGRTFMNFLKAYWESFKQYTERRLERIQSNFSLTCVHKCEKMFSEVITKAMKLFIPAGRIKMIKPNFPNEAVKLAAESDDIRQINPGDPRVNILNNKFSKLVYEHKKQKWLNHLNTATFTQGPKNLWKTIKGLTKPNKIKANAIISFDGNPVSRKQLYPELFSRQFTEHQAGGDKNMRKTLGNFNKIERTDYLQFTHKQIQIAVSGTKASKAMGLDNIAPIMLKKLGNSGISILATMINTSLRTLTIPNV